MERTLSAFQFRLRIPALRVLLPWPLVAPSQPGGVPSLARGI